MAKCHYGILAAACVAALSAFAGTSADIQALIDAADPGATVTIPSGTYLLETPVLVNKAITLAGDSADRTLVILDGQDKVNCVELSAGATLRDLTVQNGAGGKTVGSTLCGAGVYAVGATIDNCVIQNCKIETDATASVYGAGVWTSGDLIDSLVTGCVLARHHQKADNLLSQGGGVYISGGTMSGCTVTLCQNKGTQSGGVAQNHSYVLGGGAYAKSGATVEDCVFSENVVDNLKEGGSVRTDVGQGGGIFLDGTATVMRNCQVVGNTAPTGAAGVFLNGGCVENCTIKDNYLASAVVSISHPYAAGIIVKGGTVTGCSITGNKSNADGTGGSRSYGVAVQFEGANSKLLNSLIAENKTKSGGIIQFIASDCLVSNCVVRANQASDQGAPFGTEKPESVSGAVVRDCWVVDNLMTGGYGGVAFVKSSGSATVAKDNGNTLCFRNCYIARNTAGSGLKYLFYIYNTKDAGIKVENCTFVKNEGLGVFGFSTAPDSPASCALRNSLVYGDGGTVASASMVAAGVVSHTAVDNTTNFTLPDASGNVDLSETKPKNVFRSYYSDPANFALAPVSPAKDTGTAEVPDWVGDGTLDMGTGEYEVTAVADYGVKIDRVGAKPRVVNGRIDIGAAEYKYEQGDDDWGKEPTEPYTPGETLPVFENGSEKIAATIAATAPGELVAVPKGIYRMSDALTPSDIEGLRSLANHPGAVVLDFQGQSAGLYSAEAIEVRGVTISNAVGGVEVSVTDYDGNGSPIQTTQTTKAGAGICLTSAQSLITNCVVRNCSVVSDTTAVHGGGIFSAGTVVNTTVSGCLIETKTVNKVAHGGGIFLTQGASGVNLTVADCEVRATMYDVNARGTAGGGALGLCQATVEGGVFSGSVVTNIHTAGRIEGYGGGVTLYGGELRNCLVSNNWTHAGGGGVWARSDALVENCTIVDNELKKYFLATGAEKDPEYAAGAGLGLIDSATARGCRLAHNTSDHSNDRAGAGGAVALGDSTRLFNCVLEENPGAGSVIAGVYYNHQMSSVLVSNCVIRANTYGKVKRGSLFSPCFAANGTLTVVDSFICGNKGENSSYPSVLLMTLAVGTTGTTTFRNSLIADNSHSSNCPLVHYYSQTSSVKFDNCTVVGNKMSAVENTTAEWGTYFTSANTVFYNNTNGTAKAGFSANAVAQVTTTAVDNPANLTFDETTGNIDLSATDPQFADPANGVYTLKRNSPLRDKGVAGDWATAKGRTDLGDGTYAIAAAQDWGVTVTGNNRHPRLGGKKDGVIDIGACEYYHAPGLMLLLR